MELRVASDGLIPVEEVLRALGMEGREMRRIGDEFPDFISFHRRGMESYLDTLSFARLHMIWWWQRNGLSPEEIRARLAGPAAEADLSGNGSQGEASPGSDGEAETWGGYRTPGVGARSTGEAPGTSVQPSSSSSALPEEPEQLKLALLRARQEVRRLRREVEVLRSRRPRFLGIF